MFLSSLPGEYAPLHDDTASGSGEQHEDESDESGVMAGFCTR